jgi:hypothetical protein
MPACVPVAALDCGTNKPVQRGKTIHGIEQPELDDQQALIALAGTK